MAWFIIHSTRARSLLFRSERGEPSSGCGLIADWAGGYFVLELRRRREEAQVEIRKTKREESIAKRRNFAGGDDSDSDADEGTESIVSKPDNNNSPLPACNR